TADWLKSSRGAFFFPACFLARAASDWWSEYVFLRSLGIPTVSHRPDPSASLCGFQTAPLPGFPPLPGLRRNRHHRGGRSGEGRAGDRSERSGLSVDGEGQDAAGAGGVEIGADGIDGERSSANGKGRVRQRSQHAASGIDAVAGNGAVPRIGDVEVAADGGER